eukprot:jgi/Hompol1/1815/HPOL_005731-RA
MTNLTRSLLSQVVVIDVREPNETSSGIIPGAQKIPVNSLDGAFKMTPEAFKAEYGFAKPTIDQTIVVYCRSGRRSLMASNMLRDNGFTNIRDYSGGWLDWSA